MASRYQIDKAGRPDTKPHADLHTEADIMLTRYALTDDDRAAALALLQRKAPDLIHMLGLGDPQPGTPLAPVDVMCPDCFSKPTYRCTNAQGRDNEKFHVGRIRLAKQTTEVDALITAIIEEARTDG